MRPVHEFQGNFGEVELVADSRSDDSDGLTDALTLHDNGSTVRNLCLVWPDGRKAFFNYAYLVTGDLSIQNEVNTLVLSFGSYTVLLKGYRLSPLFDVLLEHGPKTIIAVNPRYVPISSRQDSVVVEIIVKSE